jgi:hypothetical protein
MDADREALAGVRVLEDDQLGAPRDDDLSHARRRDTRGQVLGMRERGNSCIELLYFFYLLQVYYYYYESNQSLFVTPVTVQGQSSNILVI